MDKWSVAGGFVLKTAATTAIILAIALAAPAANLQNHAVTILFTGLVEGTFGTCGCKVGPNGGLARRAGYSTGLRNKPGLAIIQVDLGNYFKPLGPESEAINQFMDRGLDELPIDVLNLAPGDLFRWKSMFGAGGTRTQVVSSNLVPTDPSTAPPKRHAILTIPAAGLGIRHDLRVAFLGLSDPRKVKPNSGFKGVDPEEAVSQVKREITGKYDFIVVLADIARNLGPISHDSALYRIARDNPDVYAVLSTEKRYMLHKPEQVNNAILLSSVERGRYLGQLTLSLTEDGAVDAVEPKFIDLSEDVPADPVLLRSQTELEARLGVR